jgi:hypothetical protein
MGGKRKEFPKENPLKIPRKCQGLGPGQNESLTRLLGLASECITIGTCAYTVRENDREKEGRESSGEVLHLRRS